MKRYWFSILILAAGIVFPVFISGQRLLPLLDFPSFVITVVTPLLFVTILFGFKETRKAFTIIRKNENDHDTLLKALAFFKAYGKTTWLLTIIAVITGGIGILSHLDYKPSIGPNLAVALTVMFYCGVVQMSIVIPYTVSINKKLGNSRARGDLLSLFGSLFGITFASFLLITILSLEISTSSQQSVPLPNQVPNQVIPSELLYGIRDKAYVEGYGILEYELYNVPGNESSDFQAFIWLYTGLLENGYDGAGGIYVFDQANKYRLKDNTVLSNNVKKIMDKHKCNLSTTRFLYPDGSTSFIFNCLNSNGKYEYYSIEAYAWTIRINPDDETDFQSPGDAYSEMEDYGQAIENYNLGIRIVPNDAWAFK